MRKLASNLLLTLGSRSYRADLCLTLYENKQPAIVLLSSRPEDFDENRAYFSEVLTTATVAVPPAYLTGLGPNLIVAKDYTENEGLWAQLLPLTDPNDLPLFLPLSPPRHLTLGFATCQVLRLGVLPAAIYNEQLFNRKVFEDEQA